MTCLTARQSDDGQYVHEDVDDVQVEVEGGEDVLLRTDGVLMIATQHQLGIVYQVNGKEHRSEGGIDQSDHLAREADGNDSENDEDHQTGD